MGLHDMTRPPVDSSGGIVARRLNRRDELHNGIYWTLTHDYWAGAIELPFRIIFLDLIASPS
jgi:hypothetical protein